MNCPKQFPSTPRKKPQLGKPSEAERILMSIDIITPEMRRAAADVIETPVHEWTAEQRAVVDRMRLKLCYRMLLNEGMSRTEARKLSRQIAGGKAGKLIGDLAIANGMFEGAA